MSRIKFDRDIFVSYSIKINSIKIKIHYQISKGKNMKAGILHGPKDIRCEFIPSPEISSEEVLVAVKAAGICGSDIPRYEKGTSPYNFKILGHECAGEVVEVGSNVKEVRRGDRVALIPVLPCGKCPLCRVGKYPLCNNFIRMGTRIDGCFVEFVKIPPQNLLKLPDSVDFEAASLLEPTAIALHTIKRGKISPGDLVVIMGCGPIGCLCAQFAINLGARKVYAVDIAEEKLRIAKEVGITHCINAKEKDPVEVILAEEKDGADLVIESAGVLKTLEQGIMIARKRGRVALLGLIKQDVVIPEKVYYTLLHHELNLYGVYGTDFAPFPPFHSWKTALHFIAQGKIKVKPLISHRFKIEDIGEVFSSISLHRDKYNKVIFIF